MIYLALLLPVILGFALVQFSSPVKKRLQLFLSFSGAYLLAITVLHLIPHVFEASIDGIGIYILLGILIQTTLEYISKGAEHGHIHAHDFQSRLPWMLLISLSLHAFMEGMPLGLEMNTQLLWAIIIHKLPVAIILAIFLKESKLSKGYVFLFLSLFALMSPLGSLAASTFEALQVYSAQINALIIGIFLHISTAILFESSANHKFNLQKFISILLGFSLGLWLSVH